MSDHPPPGDQPRRPDLSAERSETSRPAAGPRRFGVGTLVRWALLLFVGVILGRFFLSGDNASAPPEQAASPDPAAPVRQARGGASSPGGQGAPAADSVETATIEAIRLRQLATVRAERTQLIATAAEAVSALDAWNGAVDAWRKATAELLTGDSGKTVAADRELVKRYRALSEQPTPSADSVRATKELITAQVGPLNLAQENPNDGSAVPGDLRPLLEKSLKDARDGRKTCEQRTDELRAVMADAQASGKAGSATLAEALDRLRIDEARARAAFLATRREEAQKKGDEAIAEEQAKQDAVAKAQELIRLKELGVIQKKTDEERLVREKKDAELERQRAFVRSPEGRRQIDIYLQPYVNPGYAQPTSILGSGADRLTTKGPVSLARLQSAALLNDDMKSLFMLAFFANTPVNDRPHWQLDSPLLTPAHLSASTVEFVKSAQALLRDYGEAMVEEGLLSK
jgi:hypothetical protein